MTDSSTRICPWCSTPIPPGASVCSKCGAAVEGAATLETPGVTAPDANAPLGPTEEGRDSALGAEEAIQPPSEAVRLEMRKMELEAEIANAGGALMNSTGDDAIIVGQPSQEAIE